MSDEHTKKKTELNAAKLAAGALASVTAAALGSRLGVAGTVGGAAFASVTTAVGSAVYQQSLERGRQRVAEVARRRRPPGEADAGTARMAAHGLPGGTGPLPGTAPRPVTTLPGTRRPGMAGGWAAGGPMVRPDPDRTVRMGGPDPDATVKIDPVTGRDSGSGPVVEAVRTPRGRRRAWRWGSAAALAGLAFAAAMVVITGWESVRGTPLSGGSGGTSLGQLVGNHSTRDPGTPAPATTTGTATTGRSGSSDTTQAPTTGTSRQSRTTTEAPQPTSDQPTPQQQPQPTQTGGPRTGAESAIAGN
jgi:hypothetical protein